MERSLILEIHSVHIAFSWMGRLHKVWFRLHENLYQWIHTCTKLFETILWPQQASCKISNWISKQSWWQMLFRKWGINIQDEMIYFQFWVWEILTQNSYYSLLRSPHSNIFTFMIWWTWIATPLDFLRISSLLSISYYGASTTCQT